MLDVRADDESETSALTVRERDQVDEEWFCKLNAGSVKREVAPRIGTDSNLGFLEILEDQVDGFEHSIQTLVGHYTFFENAIVIHRNCK